MNKQFFVNKLTLPECVRGHEVFTDRIDFTHKDKLVKIVVKHFYFITNT